MLSKFAQRKNRELSPDEIIRHRFAALGYYDDSDDSGAGSAIASISQAAATLGSAYIYSKNQPQYTQVPTTTRPTYGAATPFYTSGGQAGGMGLLVFGGILAVVVTGLYFVFGR